MKRFLRLMLVGGLCWLGYGNLRLLDGVAGALRHVRDSTGSKIEMVQVARFVQMDYLDRNVLPKGDLTPLILENLRADSRAITAKSGRDPWGGAYWCLAAKGGFHVASAGPDRRWRTKDDIFFFQNLSGLGYDGPAPVARPASLVRPASPRKPPVIAPRSNRQPAPASKRTLRPQLSLMTNPLGVECSMLNVRFQPNAV